MMATLDEDSGYRGWLRSQADLGDEEVTKSCPPTPLNALWLSASMSRRIGHRQVSIHGLLAVVNSITIAREWRPWDIAIVAFEKSPVDTPPEHMLGDHMLRYVKFHHRGCALHTLCAFYYKGGVTSTAGSSNNQPDGGDAKAGGSGCNSRAPMPLPPWLQKMAHTIQAEYMGELPFAEIVARGIAVTSSMEHGVTKQSWLDSILSFKESTAEGFATAVEANVLALCPEHAHKTHDWKTPICTQIGTHWGSTKPLNSSWWTRTWWCHRLYRNGSGILL